MELVDSFDHFPPGLYQNEYSAVAIRKDALLHGVCRGKASRNSRPTVAQEAQSATCIRPRAAFSTGREKKRPWAGGSSGQVLAMHRRDISAQLLAHVRRLGPVVAQAAVELGKLRGSLAASV